ncbi:MAG: nitroreductase family protein [Planctomycetes bacterium]|nr:nitroreductase family protein [Planctomycetota bacterium]
MGRPKDPDLETIFSRFSCRDYLGDPVSPEDRKRLRKALQWAPSAGNAQPWIFYEVLDSEIRKSLARVAWNQKFVAEAPVVYVVCADPAEAERAYGLRGRELYVYQDTSAAVMNLIHAATILGYGTCWVGAFDEKKVAKILNIEPGLQPVAIIPLGRPAQGDHGSSRKTEKKIFRFVE